MIKRFNWAGMAENASSWFQKDTSWRKATRLRSIELRRGTHLMGDIHKGSAMKPIDGVVRRLPVKRADGTIDLIEIDGIFYLEAQGENTLIRAKRFC